MSAERCAHAIDEAVLVDYWMELLGEAEEQDVEEHLFGCAECSGRAAEMKALADALSDLARGGDLAVVVSDALVRSAAARGRVVREYRARPGDVVNCTVTADDELLVSRLFADLPAGARVDLCWCTEAGDVVRRYEDIPHAGSGEVVVQQSIGWAKASPSAILVLRLVSVEGPRAERTLAEYTFRHTRSLPGPGISTP